MDGPGAQLRLHGSVEDRRPAPVPMSVIEEGSMRLWEGGEIDSMRARNVLSLALARHAVAAAAAQDATARAAVPAQLQANEEHWCHQHW